jgi:alpha-tubulin suppressor-like RCC1 family protein
MPVRLPNFLLNFMFLFFDASCQVSVVSCGPSHCLLVTRGGWLWAWGSGTLGQVVLFTFYLLID